MEDEDQPWTEAIPAPADEHTFSTPAIKRVERQRHQRELPGLKEMDICLPLRPPEKSHSSHLSHAGWLWSLESWQVELMFHFVLSQGPFLLHDSHWQFKENTFYAKFFLGWNYLWVLTKKWIFRTKSDHAVCWGSNWQLEIFSVRDASDVNCPSDMALTSFMSGVTTHAGAQIFWSETLALVCQSASTRLQCWKSQVKLLFCSEQPGRMCTVFLPFWII